MLSNTCFIIRIAIYHTALALVIYSWLGNNTDQSFGFPSNGPHSPHSKYYLEIDFHQMRFQYSPIMFLPIDSTNIFQNLARSNKAICY